MGGFIMLLSLLTKEEKHLFVDLVTRIVSFDGEISDLEQHIINRMQAEMGDVFDDYSPSNSTIEELSNYFAVKNKVIKNIVFLNILATSLVDEWYSAEEHFLIEKIQIALGISDKKRQELFKIVYADRDLREKAKRVIAE